MEAGRIGKHVSPSGGDLIISLGSHHLLFKLPSYVFAPVNGNLTHGMWPCGVDGIQLSCCRHIIGSGDLFDRMIDNTADLVCNAQKWQPDLLSTGQDFNPEMIQKHLWDRHGIQVKEFKRSMFTIKLPEDPASGSPGFPHPELKKYGLLVKYPSEMTLAQEHCPMVGSAFESLLSYQAHRRSKAPTNAIE